MEKNKNPWLSYEKISTGSDAFAYTQDLGYELSDSFEHLNQGSPVRAKGIPTEKYTAGNTNDISEGVSEDTFLTQTPSKVTRRYSPTNKSEYSGYRPPDPVFVAFNNQKSNTIVPQPQLKAKTLEDLNRKEITIKTVSTKQLAANKKNDLLSPEARELLMVLGGKDNSTNSNDLTNNYDDEETIEVVKYTSTIKPIEVKTSSSTNNVVVNNSQPIIINNKTNTKIAPLITQSQTSTSDTTTNIITNNEENNAVNNVDAKEVNNTTNTVININKAKPSPFISRYTEPISFNTFSTSTATEIIDQKTQNKINKRNEINLNQIVTEVNNLVKNINQEFKSNLTSNISNSISGTSITKHENILNNIEKIALESTNIENLNSELTNYLSSVKNENNISIVTPIENYIKNNLNNFVASNQNSVSNSINSEYQNYVTNIVEEISENIVSNKFEESYSQLFTFLSSINNIQNETLKQEINHKLNSFSKSLYSSKEEYFNSIISDVKNNVNIFDNDNINQLNSYINEYMTTNDIKSFQNNVNKILLSIRSENNTEVVDQITNNLNQNYASLITNSLESFSSINQNELADVTNNAIKNEVKIQISNTMLPEVKQYISNLYSDENFTNITNQLNNILNQSSDANVIKMSIENYLNEYSSTEYSTFVDNVISIVNQNIDKLNQETINVFNNSKFQNEIKNVVIKSLGSLSNNIVQNISETKYQNYEDMRLSTLINSIQTINNVLENNTSNEYALQNLNMVNNSIESYLNETSTDIINNISDNILNNENIDGTVLNQINQYVENNSLSLNQKALSLIATLNDYKVQNNTDLDLEFINDNSTSVQVFNTLNMMKEQVNNHIDSYMNETLDMVIKLNNSNDIFNTTKLINLVEETITQLTNIGISSSTINEIKQSLNVSENKSFNEIFQMINSQSKIENEIKNYILKNNSSLSDFTLNQVQNIVNQPKYADYESFSYIKSIIEENSTQSSFETLNAVSNFISNFNDEKNQELVNTLSQVVNNYRNEVSNNSESINFNTVDIKNILIQELTENNINGLTYNLATTAYSQNINSTNEQLNTILNEISNSSTFNESNLKQLETIVNLSSTEYLNNSIVEELEQNFTSNSYSKNDIKNYIDQKKNELTISTLSQLKSIAITNSENVDGNVINYFNTNEANEEIINEVRNYLVSQLNTRNITINEQSILYIANSISSQNNFLNTINNLVENNTSETNSLNTQNMTTLNLAYQVQEILNNSSVKNVFKNTPPEIKNDVNLSISEIINHEKTEVFNSAKQQIVNILSSLDVNNSFNLNNLANTNSLNEIKEYLSNNLELSNETKNIVSFISNSQTISSQQFENITNEIVNNFKEQKGEITNILNQIAEHKNINLNDYKIEIASNNNSNTTNNKLNNNLNISNNDSNSSYNISNVLKSSNNIVRNITSDTFEEIQNILSESFTSTSEIIQNLINETNNKFEYKAAEVIFNIDKQEQNNFNNLVNELVSTISNSTNITNNQELLTSLNSSFEKYDVDIDVENTESTQIDSTVVLKQIKDIREQLSHVTNYSSANETINNFKSSSLQEIKNQFTAIFTNNEEYQQSKIDLTNQLNNVSNFNEIKQFLTTNSSLFIDADLETINNKINNQATVNNIVEKIESIYRFKNVQKISSGVSKDITYVEVLNYLENNLNNPNLINQITTNLINSRSIIDLKNIIQNNISTFTSSQLEQINNIVSKNENYISQINTATNEEQITNILNESKKEVLSFTISQITNYLQNNNNPVVQNFLSKSLQENIELSDFITLINENKKYLTTEDNIAVQNILSKTEVITNLFSQSLDVNNFEESVKIATNISDQKTYMEALNVLSTNEKFETLQNNVNQLFSENKSVLELQTIINSNTEIFNDEEKSTINNILEQNKKENNLYQSATTIEEVKNIFETMQSNLVKKSVVEVANYLVNNASTARTNNILNTEVFNNSNSINEIKNIIENNVSQISKYDYATLQNIISKNELLQNSYTFIQNTNAINSNNVTSNFENTQNTMLQIVSYLSTVLNEQAAQNILEKIFKEERTFENINSYVQEIKNELTQEQIINVQNIVAKNESLNKYSTNSNLSLEIDAGIKYSIENELISQASQVITNNISNNRNQYISELKSVLETNVENQTFSTESLMSEITNTVNEYSQSAENTVSNLFEAMDARNYQNVSNTQKQEILNKINTFVQSYNFENVLTNVLNNNVNINQNIVNNESIKLLTEIEKSNLNISRLETSYNNIINSNSVLSSIVNTENQINNNSNIFSNIAGVTNNQANILIDNTNLTERTINNNQNINNTNNFSFETLEQIFAHRITNQFENAYNHLSSINNIGTNNNVSYQSILNQVRQFIENKNNTNINAINKEVNNTVSKIENIVTLQNQETVNYAQEALSIVEQNIKNITENNNLPSNVNKLTTEDNNYFNIENNISSTNTVSVTSNEENINVDNLRIEKVWDTFVQKEVSKIVEEVEKEKKESSSIVNNVTNQETVNNYTTSTENKNIYEINSEQNTNETHYHQSVTSPKSNNQIENITNTKTTNIENINIQEMTETVFSKIEQRFKTYNITHEDMIILKNKILTEVVEIYEKRTTREIEQSELRIKQEVQRMFKQLLNS
jgi:hypothetical protein